jgi:hypothetical protein
MDLLGRVIRRQATAPSDRRVSGGVWPKGLPPGSFKPGKTTYQQPTTNDVSAWHRATRDRGTKGREAGVEGVGSFTMACFFRTAHFLLARCSNGPSPNSSRSRGLFQDSSDNRLENGQARRTAGLQSRERLAVHARFHRGMVGIADPKPVT